MTIQDVINQIYPDKEPVKREEPETNRVVQSQLEWVSEHPDDHDLGVALGYIEAICWSIYGLNEYEAGIVADHIVLGSPIDDDGEVEA